MTPVRVTTTHARGRRLVRAREGFTLLEAVVSLAIISIVAVATLAEVGSQLRAIDHAKHTTEAAALAQDRLTAVQLLGVADLPSLPDSLASGRFAPPLDLYTWQVAVQQDPDIEGLNNVSVQINWPDGAYTLGTRIYHAPPNLNAGNNTGPSQNNAGGG